MIYIIIALLVGAVVGYQGYIEGFRKMWPVLFNVLVSVYLAVLGTRAVCKMAPGIEAYQYFKAPMVIVFAIVVWLALYGVIKLFVKEDFIHSLPQLFEDIGGAILGFFTGFVCTGFVIFSLFIFVSNSKAMPGFIQTQIGMPAIKTVQNSCVFTGTLSLQTCKSNEEIPLIMSWFTGITSPNKASTTKIKTSDPNSSNIIDTNEKITESSDPNIIDPNAEEEN